MTSSNRFRSDGSHRRPPIVIATSVPKIENPPVIHPVIRTHPVSKRKGLFRQRRLHHPYQ